ncbi:MAG: excinuclease ABC subunit UvrC [Treponema sp.]|nr:excinuclease ABC subunit UvrC [Treponema sp.]
MKDQIISENIENLKAAALDAPKEPGVYIMKNDDGQIIYVGKAKSLKNRLKSYFSGEKDIKTATLLRHIRSFETIIVASEYEALLLENTLIKQHSPKYNISLKDGKTYPVIRVTHEDFPRIFRTRRVIHDGSLYYGPFPNVQGVDTMLELIDKLFPLRKCKTVKKRGPCMYYHIGRCMAPCCAKISASEYSLHVQRVQKLLSGETDALIIDLTVQMHEEAKKLQFEQAARIRNAIKQIENISCEENAVEDLNPEDRDYIAWAADGVLSTFTVFSMRGGRMTGRNLFRTRSAACEWESLEIFITSYYDFSRLPPVKIYLQTAGNSSPDISPNSLNYWFKEKFGYEPELLTPAEKHHEAILTMAKHNALEDLRKRLKERGAGPALDELAGVLNLETRPERIEGFDIAQLDGKHPVASLISFKNGIPDRKNYRHFKLRTVVGIVDDFASMREVVKRRYSRLIREGSELPDLILIDGGIGQVNAAKGVLDELKIDCGVVGLAKREEELWLPGARKPIVLSRQSEALKVLQHVRDECHRFATGLNQRLRSKDLFFPVLESVEGIGPKRAAVIMKKYESIANIAAADVNEISESCKLSEAAARAVRAVAKISLENQAQEINILRRKH